MAGKADGSAVRDLAHGAGRRPGSYGARPPSGVARLASLVAVIGEPDPAFTSHGLLDAVGREADRNWKRYVEPLVEARCPELRSTPAYQKIRIAALDFFACGPYFALILGRRRPWALRLLTATARVLKWDRACLSRRLALGLPLYARARLASEGRRIALGTAFTGVVDEAFDHGLADLAPARRIELIRQAVRAGPAGIGDELSPGNGASGNGSLSLIGALCAALAEGLTPAEATELREILESCLEWAEAELARLEARPDPSGLAHRGAGIEAGTRGLAWTVESWIGPSERDWMRSVSTFMQMLDDWVDLEADLARGERTPVAEGVWTLEGIEARFRETTESIVVIAERNGEHYPPYLDLLRESYVQRIRVLLQKMVSGEAA